MAPLQRLTVRTIEDPAEQAALDERLNQIEAAASGDSTSTSKTPGAHTLADDSRSPMGGIRKKSKSPQSIPARRSVRKRRR